MPKRLAAKPADFSSLFLRIEELILASSGADVFEETLKLLASKLYHETRNVALLEGDENPLFSNLSGPIREQCVQLLAPYSLSDAGEALDALFETLITRTSKGQKGQFFTPRYVVDFCVRLAQLEGGEAVLDPACGSGAFLNAALEAGAGSVSGYDIDNRAVRIARMLMLAHGREAAAIKAGDGLREAVDASADAVLTNPPFAGEINDARLLSGFELGAGRARVERDVLFLECSLRALRPGGKLAIILPHSKFAGKPTRYIREWLLRHVEVLAVIGLGRNTFLPHTHQKANVLLARRRSQTANGTGSRIFFAQSVEDRKDTRGRITGAGDLEDILERYFQHDRRGGKQVTILDENFTLAPERRGAPAGQAEALRIGDVIKNTSSYCKPGEAGPFVVVDTTHAVDGFIAARPLGVIDALQSTKKRLQPGDVIVSRLRPYLRQIAYVDAALFEKFPGATLCCSTEFYVLRSIENDAAFLVPFLLTPDVQALLAGSQEGGHHPRVPASFLAGVALPAALVHSRGRLSTEFSGIIASLRAAELTRERLISQITSGSK